MSRHVISSVQAEVLAGVKQGVCEYVDVKLGSDDVVITESLHRSLLFHCCAAVGSFMLREHDKGQPYYSTYAGSGKFPLTVDGVKAMLCEAIDGLCEAGYLDVSEGDGEKLTSYICEGIDTAVAKGSRGLTAVESMLEDLQGVYTERAVCEYLGVTSGELEEMVKSNRVLGFPLSDFSRHPSLVGVMGYPGFQFEGGSVREDIVKLLGLYGSSDAFSPTRTAFLIGAPSLEYAGMSLAEFIKQYPEKFDDVYRYCEGDLNHAESWR